MAAITPADIAAHIQAAALNKPNKRRPYIVGVTGADASGKSQLAKQTHAVLNDAGIKTHVIHVDDFHKPKAQRYAGTAPEPKKFRFQSIDFDTLKTEVLIPLRQSGSLNKKLQLLDIPSDQYSLVRQYNIHHDSIVIIEGIFLIGDELRSFIDSLICLVVSEDELVRRGIKRDAKLLGVDARRRFEEKYLPAQRALFKEFPPQQYADLVIDNNDFTNPKLVFGNLAK